MKHLDADLAELLCEVSVLSRKERFDFADLERLISLYRQAAYLFTYIEGNAKYVDAGVSFETVKAALLDDVILRDSLASRGRELMAEAGHLSATWTGALRWFLQSPGHVRAEVETRSAMAGVEEVLRRIDNDRASLLAHLGLGDGVEGSVNAMVSGLRRVNEPATRSKLLRAWHRVGEAHTDSLAAAMDLVVEKRWQYATALGHRSVAEHGFVSCDVSPKIVGTFMEAFTTNALRERRVFLSRFEGGEALDDEVRAFSLLTDGRHLRSGHWPALVDLGALLEFITDTVRRVLRVALSARPAEAGIVGLFDVTKGADTLGTLALDRVVEGTSGQVLGPAYDSAVAGSLRARVLCVMGSSSSEAVSVEATQQILHAMGHALVHLVVRPRVPSASGLDILPLERLEGLSHWFEKLMDSSAFEDRVAVTSEQRVALGAFRRARDDRARNTRLEQAVVATIDQDVHQQRGCSVRDVFDTRIGGMGTPVGVSFERVVRFMAAPLFRDHPGMGFVYPWGAAFGATQTRPTIVEQSLEPRLATYFDLAAAVTVPDVDATFSSTEEPLSERKDKRTDDHQGGRRKVPRHQATPATKRPPLRTKPPRTTEAILLNLVQSMREKPTKYRAVRRAVTSAPTDKERAKQLLGFATTDREVATMLPAQVRGGARASPRPHQHHHLHSSHGPRLLATRDDPSADAELPHPRTFVDSFTESDKWFVCGRRPRKSQGWKLYVSLTPVNAAEIVSRVGPLVAEAGYHFRYIRTLKLLRKLNAGRYGYTRIGECFVIYLHRLDRSFIDTLKAHLTPYCDQNPDVPRAKSFGARLPLYYRYGSYDGPRLRIGARNIKDNRPTPLPRGKKDLLAPFTAAIPDNPAVDSFLVRYPVFQAVKQKGKCGVFLGLDLASETFQQVVLKIGYHRGQVQLDGTDGCAFLRREHVFYQELAARGLAALAPALVDALDEPRKVILVLEYVAGDDLLTQLLENRLTIAQLEQCWEILGQLHAADLYLVDAKLGNFIATEDGRVRILDFEAAGVVGTPPPDFRTFVIDPVLDNPVIADRVHFLVSLLYPYEKNQPSWADRRVDLYRLLRIQSGSEIANWALDRLRNVVTG